MRSLFALALFALWFPAAARGGARRIVIFHQAGADGEARKLASAVELYTRDLGCAVALRRWPGSPALAREEAEADHASIFLRFDTRARPAAIDLWRIAPAERYRFLLSRADRRAGFTPAAVKIRAFVAPVVAPPDPTAPSPAPAARAPPAGLLPRLEPESPTLSGAPTPPAAPATPADRSPAAVPPNRTPAAAISRPPRARPPVAAPVLEPDRRERHLPASRATTGLSRPGAPVDTGVGRRPWQLDLRGGVSLSTFPDEIVPTALLRATYFASPAFGVDLEAAFVGGFNQHGSTGDASLWDLPLGAGVAWRIDVGRLSFWGGPRVRLHLVMASGDADDESRRGAAQKLAVGLGGAGTAAWRFGRLAVLAGVGAEAVLPHYGFTLDGAPGPALGVLDLDLSLGLGGTF